MTSITEREQDDKMPTVIVNDRTALSLPLVMTIVGLIGAAFLWLNSLNVDMARLKTDQFNDRERLQRIESTIERVETKIDRLRYEQR